MNELALFNKMNSIQELSINFQLIKKEIYKIASKFSLKPKIFKIKDNKRSGKRSINKTKISKFYIIDIEGDPFFLLGLLLDDTIIQLYLEDFNSYENFLICCLKIINLLYKNKMTPFSFGFFKESRLKDAFTALTFNKTLKDIESFLIDYEIINLQENNHESLTEALLKIDYLTTDILFLGNFNNIHQLFKQKQFDLILKHNQNCLLNESIILQRRFLKKNRLK